MVQTEALERPKP